MTLTSQQQELHDLVLDASQRRGRPWPTVLAQMVTGAGDLRGLRHEWQLSSDDFDAVMDALRLNADAARVDLAAVVDQAICDDSLNEVERMQQIREAHATWKQAQAGKAVTS